MNQKATAARHDQKLRESFIRDNEQTILKIASKVSGKYITRSDDEWSVALLAFNKAIDTYSEEKGEYLSYAGVLIKRALIDHYRAEKKYAPELPASYEMFTGEGEIAQNTEIVRAVARDGTAEQDRTERERDLKDEILEVGLILKKYGFSNIKCVSTGHHPERFPCLASKNHSGTSFAWKLISRISRIFKLGDTFELYCTKGVGTK